MIVAACLVPVYVIWRFMSHIVDRKTENYKTRCFVKFHQNLRKRSSLKMVRFFLRSVYICMKKTTTTTTTKKKKQTKKTTTTTTKNNNKTKKQNKKKHNNNNNNNKTKFGQIQESANFTAFGWQAFSAQYWVAGAFITDGQLSEYSIHLITQIHRNCTCNCNF